MKPGIVGTNDRPMVIDGDCRADQSYGRHRRAWVRSQTCSSRMVPGYPVFGSTASNLNLPFTCSIPHIHDAEIQQVRCVIVPKNRRPADGIDHLEILQAEKVRPCRNGASPQPMLRISMIQRLPNQVGFRLDPGKARPRICTTWPLFRLATIELLHSESWLTR